MTVNSLEARAHELVGQLDASKLAAVVHLLEVMVDEDELTEEDITAVSASRDYFEQGGKGLSFEEVVSECGFTMDQVLNARSEEIALKP